MPDDFVEIVQRQRLLDHTGDFSHKDFWLLVTQRLSNLSLGDAYSRMSQTIQNRRLMHHQNAA